jgi:hypothetical protein
MRALLIDPTAKTIEEITLNNPNKSLQEFYDIIGCNLVEIVDLGYNILLVIDEEGRLKNFSGAFKFLGCDDLFIAGKAVVIGDKQGKFISLGELKENFEKIVEWVDPADVPEPTIEVIGFN